MKKLWTLTSLALEDAALAESLARDPEYRRWLRADTGMALGAFQLARPWTWSDPEVTEGRVVRRRLLLRTEES